MITINRRPQSVSAYLVKKVSLIALAQLLVEGSISQIFWHQSRGAFERRCFFVAAFDNIVPKYGVGSKSCILKSVVKFQHKFW